MTQIHLLFPHQLFKDCSLLEASASVYLVEESLFFTQYPFHKQKIAFHRATMKAYEAYLKSKQIEVNYVEAVNDYSDSRQLIAQLKRQGITHINYIDTTDNWLQSRIQTSCEENGITSTVFDSALFLNTISDLSAFFRSSKKKYHHTTFYTEQRKQRKLCLLYTSDAADE